MTANAKSTTITTSVPSHCSLQVSIAGRGNVCIDEKSIHTTETISVQRHKKLVIEFHAGIGYQLASVSLNGEDVSQELSSGKLTLDSISFDSTLTVVFMKKSAVWPGANPPTGDNIMNFITCCGMSLMGLLILEKRRRKQ